MDQPTRDFMATLHAALGRHKADLRVAAALVAVERVLRDGEDLAAVDAWLSGYLAELQRGSGGSQPPADPPPLFPTSDDPGRLDGPPSRGGRRPLP